LDKLKDRIHFSPLFFQESFLVDFICAGDSAFEIAYLLFVADLAGLV
jgi:hypothetical protein